MSERGPRVWALLGHRTGDDNQVLALAEALGTGYTAHRLSYGPARMVPNRVAPPGFYPLAPASRAALAPPWPDVVIGAGQRHVPVSRAIKTASGGRTLTVGIGWPRCDPALLDLVVTTANYPVPDPPNVLRLPVAMARALPPEGEAEAAWWARLEGSVWGLLVGGSTGPHRMRAGAMAAALEEMSAQAERAGVTLLVATSRRTPDAVTRALSAVLDRRGAGDRLHAPGGPVPIYPGLLRRASCLAVTSDSVAMLSEAIASGAAVGVVPVPARGPRAGLVRASRAWSAAGGTGWARDVDAFVRGVQAAGLAGTLDDPVAGDAPDAAALAAAQVRAMLAAREGRPSP